MSTMILSRIRAWDDMLQESGIDDHDMAVYDAIYRLFLKDSSVLLPSYNQGEMDVVNEQIKGIRLPKGRIRVSGPLEGFCELLKLSVKENQRHNTWEDVEAILPILHDIPGFEHLRIPQYARTLLVHKRVEIQAIDAGWTNTDYQLKPLVKCVGGKTKLVIDLASYIPVGMEIQGYCEPFVGGGALFWYLTMEGRLPNGSNIILGDIRSGLIRLYEQVRDDPDQLIRDLHILDEEYADPEKNNGDMYYRIREFWNSGDQRPAHYVFLAQTAFNGLWRENKNGRMNVPWGKYINFSRLSDLEIMQCNIGLQGVTVVDLDFRDVMDRVENGWIVYVDPPYWGTFSSYSASGFDNDDQVALIKACQFLAQRNLVIYTNTAHPGVGEALGRYWPNGMFHVHQFGQTIAGTIEGRKARSEIICVGNE